MNLEDLIERSSREFYLPDGPRQMVEMVGKLLSTIPQEMHIIIKKTRLDGDKFQVSIEVVSLPKDSA